MPESGHTTSSVPCRVCRPRATATGAARRRTAIESLERRVLFDAVTGPGPVGDEFFVNDAVHAHAPSVAVNDEGEFVVAWESYHPSGNEWNIYARRFAANGAPLGPEFRVNQTVTSYRRGPDVATDAAGNFVIAWTHGDFGGDVYARRYAADGTPRSGEFRVNTYTDDSQGGADVAMDDAGNFVVTWESTNQPGGAATDVYAQRFSAAGARIGTEFRVNANISGSQFDQSVAMDGAGDLVVAWYGTASDDSLRGIYARKFNAAGVTAGPDLLVRPDVIEPHSAVSMADDGRFIVAWAEHSQGATSVFARAYDAAGATLAPAFVAVGGAKDLLVAEPAVAMDSDGHFVVAGKGRSNDDSTDGIFARWFGPDLAPAGPRVQVNTVTAGRQELPAAAMTRDGRSVIAWSSGVKAAARVFGIPPPPRAAVVGRHVFYNDSAFDGGSEFAGPADDNAIATDKHPLLPGELATFSNITSYTRGINGVMFDVSGKLPLTALAGIAAGVELKTGTGGDPAAWADAPRPQIGIRAGAGVGGSDRITLTWPGGGVRNAWLRVTVTAPPQYGLAPDTFTFGNLVAEAGEPALTPAAWTVTPADALAPRADSPRRRVGITHPTDHNRDGAVNVLDTAAARAHLGRSLARPGNLNPEQAAAAAISPAPARAPTRPARRSLLEEQAALDPPTR